MSTSVYYRIPKKRKYCVVVYADECFQSFQALEDKLTSAGFSSAVISKIAGRIRAREITKEEMVTVLTELGKDETEISKILKGEVIKNA